MKKIVFTAFLASFFLMLLTTPCAASPFIYGPYSVVANNDVIVSLAIGESGEFDSAVSSGIEKEITYTIELLRAWKFWPDEFIVSKKVIRTVKYDNLRDQYLTTYRDSNNQSKPMIKTHDELKEWFFDVNAVNLVNVKELSPGSYYIRAIVEFRSIDQLPIIGFIMHFIPESKMTLAKESELFNVEGSFEKR